MLDYDSLIEIFKTNSNAEFNEFNKKIINSSVETIGCTVPFVRSIAKQCSLSDTLLLPLHKCYEIDLLIGLTVSQCKLPFEEKSRYIMQFADTIENWAVCDVSTVKVPQKERADYFALFSGMLESKSVFVCRYGIVNLLANYLDCEHVEDIFGKLRDVKLFGQYYVDMAVAWLIATAMAKCRDETVDFMQGEARSILNPFSYNRALQKMRDSKRISQQDKQWTYTLKM